MIDKIKLLFRKYFDFLFTDEQEEYVDRDLKFTTAEDYMNSQWSDIDEGR